MPKYRQISVVMTSLSIPVPIMKNIRRASPEVPPAAMVERALLEAMAEAKVTELPASTVESFEISPTTALRAQPRVFWRLSYRFLYTTLIATWCLLHVADLQDLQFVIALMESTKRRGSELGRTRR
jgi:hypothetical protein